VLAVSMIAAMWLPAGRSSTVAEPAPTPELARV